MNKRILKISLFFSIFSILFSCEEKSNKEETSIVENNNVKLIVEFKSELNDKFEVFYTLNAIDIITGDYKMEQFVYGSKEMQKIEFEFPKDKLPYNIRLDIGNNPDLQNITIKNISVVYKQKSINGDNGKFLDFFNLYKESIRYNDQKYLFEIYPKDGIIDPFFYANDLLNQKLSSFYK